MQITTKDNVSAKQSWCIDRALTTELVAFGDRDEASLFTILLTVFSILLYRDTDLERSPIAISVDGFNGINSVRTLEIQLSDNISCAELSNRVDQAVIDARTQIEPQLAEPAKNSHPVQNLTYNSLFQVILTGSPVVPLQLASSLLATFDLFLLFTVADAGIEGCFEYRTDVFDAATIDRTIGHFQTLLAGIVANPAQAISQLPLLTAVEREQLLVTWNDTQVDYPQDKCIHQLFEEQARKTPDAVAVVFGADSLTYAQLDRRSNQLAHHLQSVGVGIGSLVGICVERSIELVVGLFGILKAGAAYVPIDPNYPAERLEYLIEDSQVQVLLTQARLVERLPVSEAQLICLDTEWGNIAQQSDTQLASGVNFDDLAYVIYTSGSTGKPKGVAIRHQGVANYLNWCIRAYAVAAGSGAPVQSSIAFDATITSIFSPLLVGQKVVLLPEKQEIEALVTLLQSSHNLCPVKITPAHLEILKHLLDPQQMQGRVNTVVVGGEALLGSNLAFWRENAPQTRIINEYGPTETVVGCCVYEVNESTNLAAGIPIGKPIANTQLYVLDRGLQPVPIGIKGELYIGGDGVAQGYWRREELTQQRFIPSPFVAGARLYKTGDLARYLPDGNLEYLGRIDEQVKIRGFRIELGEVEASLSQHPDVDRLAVVVNEDIPGNKRLVAYLVPHQDRQPSVQSLRDFLARKLPAHAIPELFVTLDDLPLTSNGKVDRRALPAPQINRGKVDPQPQSQTEQIITTVWQEILKIDRVGLDENFFDLGGNSILIAQVSSQLSAKLGRRISTIDLFQYPTVRTLAQHLVDENQGQRSTTRTKKTDNTSIAIIGMAGRFPGADNLDEFWQNLRDGVESIELLSDAQLAAAGVAEELINDPNYVKAAAILPNIDEFDATFFGYNAREAQIADPQQRLFLESAWTALEHAGYPVGSDRYSIGVYGGTGQSTYLFNQVSQNQNFAAGRFVDTTTGIQVSLGNGGDFLTTKVAYKLNLTGPAINVQTACSTSLVAIHMACQSLLQGDCEIALAGGVSILVPQQVGYLYQEGLMLSPDGHCRSFDAAAQGTIFGDGVGIVVLKPLDRAIEDGDTIHAVIKGTAINNDGNLKVSYTAPSINGQVGAISAAQSAAGVAPETISYIEAHGTATPLGDPIEIQALTQAFGGGEWGCGGNNFGSEQKDLTSHRHYCAIGSVKSNVGHLITAAGVAGLIKTVLALKHQQLPPSLHFDSPNPAIDFDNSPFYVNTTLTPWTSNGAPRRAGVSSFGFGGTNAHAVLEEWQTQPLARHGRKQQLLLLSAKTATALTTATNNLAAHLHQDPAINLADVAYTLSVGRVAFNHRQMVVVGDVEQATQILTTPLKQNGGIVKQRSIVFMFSGQSSQYANMTRDIYETEVYFRAQVDLCCQLLQPDLGFDLRDILYPSPDLVAAATAQLQQTEITQPALFVVEYALAQLWMSWGIVPAATIGHSVGEYVAATLAGVFSLADALHLVAVRGKLMSEMPTGAMLSLPLSESALQPLLVGTAIEIAVINHPDNCVVSGTTEAIESFDRQLAEREIECRPLHTSHAFHSAMMEPILAPFIAKFAGIQLHPPTIPYISNVTGTWITAELATDPHYYAQHLRQTVRFADGVAQLFDNPDRILLEVGPGNTLATLAKRHPDRIPAQITLASVRHSRENRDDLAFLLETLGQMWMAGVEIEWDKFYPERHTRIPLPTYPFERKRYWIEPSQPQAAKFGYVPIWERSISTPMLIFVDRNGLAIPLVELLKSQGKLVIAVQMGEKFTRIDRDLYQLNPDRLDDYTALIRSLIADDLAPKTICHCWNLTDDPSRNLAADKDRILYLIQSLAQENLLTKIDLVAITDRDLESASQRLKPLLVMQSLPTQTDVTLGSIDSESSLLSQLEQIISKHWQQVLGLESIELSDNFFDLGGDSLVAVQLLTKLRKEPQIIGSIELSLRQFFQTPTIAEFIAAMDRSQDQSTDLVIENIILRRENRSSAVLSFSQQRLWFLQQIDTTRSDYNLKLSAHISGDLNIPALQQSLDTIVVHHEILRTNYLNQDGNAIQIIGGARAVELSIFDLQDLPLSERDRSIKSVLDREFQRPFDLAADLMLRACLIKVALTEHIILIGMHHIASDGWSMSLFSPQLSQLYQAFAQGQPSPLTELPIQYADFAEWQRQYLNQERLSALMSHWQQHLAGAPALLPLPTNRPRAAVATFEGTSLSFALPSASLEALTTFGKTEKVTVFMTLLAAFNTLLYRYTNSEDIVLGSVMRNREREETQALIGFFVNTVALRTDLSGNPSFRELLSRVKAEALDAYTYQDLPFEKLVEAVQPKRDSSYSPIFQVMFGFDEDISKEKIELPGTIATPWTVKHNAAPFDLTLYIERFVEPTSTEIIFKWRYNTALFDATTIERMNGHFQTILDNVIANPDRSISELNILTDREQHQLLVEWNATQTDYPQHKCIHQLFEEQVALSPDNIALVFESTQLSYRELNDRSNQLAHHLLDLDLPPDAPIAIYLDRSIQTIVSILAILKAGRAYLPIDPSYPAARIAFMLENGRVPVILTRSALIEQLPPHPAQVICLDSHSSKIALLSPENPDSSRKSDDLAYIMYTSGSTGQPKGVCVPHKGVVRLVKATNYADFSADRVFLQLAPIAFDASTLEIWGSLLNGAKLVLFPGDKPSLTELGRIIQQHQITTLWLTAGLFHLMVDERLTDLAPIRQLIAGGDILSVPHVRKVLSQLPNCQLINGYGPTENTTFTCCYPISSTDALLTSVPIGRPIANTQVYLLDTRLQPVPIGIPGELYIGGDGLAQGYLDRADLTLEKFIPNPFDRSTKLYRTGDLARYQPDGNIEFLGRIDNQVKIRGFRIELGEIEAAIDRHPDVQAVTVIDREDRPGDKRLVAYIVTQQQLTDKELRTFIQSQLPDYMIPSAFVFLAQLPLTPNGKVDRHALPAPESLESAAANISTTPRDDLERELTTIWERVLGLKSIGINDNFFELGGHSLIAVRLFSEIDRVWGQNLPLATLFQHQTISELADVLRQDGWTAPWSCLVLIQSGGSKPPLFCIHPLGGNILEYYTLANYLGRERPIYGLQSQGLDGKQPLLHRVEDMAAHYIQEIRKVQPQGPYSLIGYSFGGVVAFEMAQQLSSAGEQMALVAMLDSSLAQLPYLKPSLIQSLIFHPSNLWQLDLQEKLSYISGRINYHLYQWQGNSKENFLTDNFYDRDMLTPELLAVLHANLQASQDYVAGVYQGEVVVFRCQVQERKRLFYPELGWSKFVTGNLTVQSVPGLHFSMIREPRVQFVAERLRFYLNKAVAEAI
jgi:amino acid adenylation domain-containing protein